MPKTPRPDHDTPPDPRTELLADLDARIGEPARPSAPGSPLAAGEGSGGLFVRPEQVDLVLRLHQLGAAWRERVGNDTGKVPTRIDRFEVVQEVGRDGGLAFHVDVGADDVRAQRQVEVGGGEVDGFAVGRLDMDVGEDGVGAFGVGGVADGRQRRRQMCAWYG